MHLTVVPPLRFEEQLQEYFMLDLDFFNVRKHLFYERLQNVWRSDYMLGSQGISIDLKGPQTLWLVLS